MHMCEFFACMKEDIPTLAIDSVGSLHQDIQKVFI